MTASLADTAYRTLHRAIVTARLEPGAAISEAQLESDYGMSRAAVRAALARLRTEGLVVAEARRAHTVAPLTMRDVVEIYDLRLLLEPEGAAAAAGRMAERELARLRTRCRAVRSDATSLRSAEAFLAVNRDVHLAVARAGGNGRAVSIVTRLLDDSERARLFALRAGAADRGRRTLEEHLAVLDAIEGGDGDQAREVMAAAIERFRDELVAALREVTYDAPINTA